MARGGAHIQTLAEHGGGGFFRRLARFWRQWWARSSPRAQVLFALDRLGIATIADVARVIRPDGPAFFGPLFRTMEGLERDGLIVAIRGPDLPPETYRQRVERIQVRRDYGVRPRYMLTDAGQTEVIRLRVLAKLENSPRRAP